MHKLKDPTIVADLKAIKERKNREKKVNTPTVELISYEIKAVIPTGSYANIQPCIIVKARNLEEADRFVMPYIRNLYQQYAPSVLPQVTYAVSQSPVTEMGKEFTAAVTTTTEEVKSTTAFENAEKALSGCQNPEVLRLIERKISKSPKLTHDEKFALLKMVATKATELDK